MEKKTAAVIGIGVFGKRMALSLTENGIQVLALDKEQKIVEEVKKQVNGAAVIDSTDEHSMRKAGVDQVDMAVCAIGNDYVEDSIMTTALLSKLGVDRIMARAGNQTQERILYQVGAHEVINPEEATAERAALRLAQAAKGTHSDKG